MEKLERVEVVGQRLASAALKHDDFKGAKLNAYAVCDSNEPEEAHYVDGAVCYAYLPMNMHDKMDTIIARVNPMAIEGFNTLKADFGSYSQHHFSIRELKRFYSWLANHSPFRRAFVTKSATHMINKHFAVVRTQNQPANYIVGALTAMRQPWEYTGIIKTWLYLRENAPDIDPALAFYLAHEIQVKPHLTGDQLVVHGTLNSHTVFNAGMSKEAIDNFIHGRVVKANEPLPANYRGIVNMWGPMSGAQYWFKNKLVPALKSSGKVDLSRSLFAWNNLFYTDKERDTEVYLAKDNLQLITDICNETFGGNR